MKKNVAFTLEGGEELSKQEFCDYFEKKVRKTIRVHGLVGKKEKIVVACSGGKDSSVALYLLHKVVSNRNVSVEAFHIDQSIGKYSSLSKDKLVSFCKQYKIPLHITSYREEFGSSLCYIRDALHAKGVTLKSCAICGILKRYTMNKWAKKLGVTRIATGHNLDDEAQSILMNIFKNNVGLLSRLGPMSGVRAHSGFVPRIKPLYMCSEEEVLCYSKLMGFDLCYDECPCRKDSFRLQVGKSVNVLDKQHKGIKFSTVRAFLEMAPLLKKEYSKGSVKVCTKCGEPAAGKICSTCNLIGKIKSD